MNIYRCSSARGKLPLKILHCFPNAFRIKSKLLSGVFKAHPPPRPHHVPWSGGAWDQETCAQISATPLPCDFE